MNRFNEFFTQRIQRRLARHLNNWHIYQMARRVAGRAPAARGKPVIFFKASSGIDDFSWNSAFHLLTSWGLRLQGIPVIFFACKAGMSRCVLGTDRNDPSKTPPCRSCVYQSKTLYTGAQVEWFKFQRDIELEQALEGLSLEELSEFKWKYNSQRVTPAQDSRYWVARSGANSATTRQSPDNNEEIAHLPTPVLADGARGPAGTGSSQRTLLAHRPLVGMTPQEIPLGALCLPGLRWILRRHNLIDDEKTRFFLREYILSAWLVAREFESLLERVQPQALVVFNGQFYPEATAKWVAQQRGVRVVTHEVGLQPMTGFFTEGEATAYPISIPESFELDDQQNARLDDYLQKRFQGNFSMAGINFWADIKGLDEAFLTRAAGFKHIVPVFTNVIFDTSQPHANTVFADMFAWLDLLLDVAGSHLQTLFVIRAHPDEARAGKESQESVAAWVASRVVTQLPNVVFVPPHEFLSSYELITRAKFVLVYNSTIGLEASIMGAAVLAAGKARYTQYPSVFFPQSVEEYRRTLEGFLDGEKIDVPAGFRHNARRFLYYQLFRTSLPFGDFLERGMLPVNARLKSFDPSALLPENSPAVAAVTKGLLENGDFLLKA